MKQIGRSATTCLAVAFFAVNTFLHLPTASINSRHLLGLEVTSDSSQHDSSVSIQQIQEWRQKYSQQCHDETSTKEDLMQTLSAMTQPSLSKATIPTIRETTVNKEESIFPCQFTFLDFGANVGDSLGKFIDSAVEPCPAKGIPKNPRFHLESSTMIGGDEQFHMRENVLVRSSRAILLEQQIDGHHHKPEEYCYFGIEGNPLFTERLRALEQRIMESTPRPVRHAHFLTETVGSGRDEPTVLYLDTVNSKQNFWGSSIYAGHRDVQKSAEQKQDGKSSLVQAPVDGVTLSTLLQKTVVKAAGSHVLIKMDIEGGEYVVLEEAYQSGVLCDYAQSGVKVNFLLETHHPDTIGEKNFDLQHWRHVKKTLQDCGVVLRKGRDAG